LIQSAPQFLDIDAGKFENLRAVGLAFHQLDISAVNSRHLARKSMQASLALPSVAGADMSIL
jgi:hypothetical protein